MNAATHDYNAYLLSNLNDIMPSRTIRVKQHQSSWVTNQFVKLCSSRDKLYKLARRSRDTNVKDSYRIAKNQCITPVEEAETRTLYGKV